MKTFFVFLATVSVTFAQNYEIVSSQAWNDSTGMSGLVFSSVSALDFSMRGYVPLHHYAFIGEVRWKEVSGSASIRARGAYPSLKGESISFCVTEARDNQGAPLRFTGDGDWRSFILPIEHTDILVRADIANAKAAQWQIIQEMEGSGVAFVRNLKLVEYPDAEWEKLPEPLKAAWSAQPVPALPLVAAAMARPWWSDRAAGWIGSVGGIVLGLIGAFLGFMGCRGTMSGWVEGALASMTLAGGLLLIGGGVALACRQPYGVWYPLLLFGIVMAAVFGLNWVIFRRKRREIELRRMASLDSAEG